MTTAQLSALRTEYAVVSFIPSAQWPAVRAMLSSLTAAAVDAIADGMVRHLSHFAKQDRAARLATTVEA